MRQNLKLALIQNLLLHAVLNAQSQDKVEIPIEEPKPTKKSSKKSKKGKKL